MNIDINEIMPQMLDAVKDSLKNDWEKVKDGAEEFFQDHEERLETLAYQRLNGMIDDEYFKARLGDEADLLKGVLRVERIGTEAAIEDAANAALDVLYTAIEDTLKI